jgi:hypothetical protein
MTPTNNEFNSLIAIQLGCIDSQEEWNNEKSTNWTNVVQCMQNVDAAELLGWQRFNEQTNNYFIFPGLLVLFIF